MWLLVLGSLTAITGCFQISDAQYAFAHDPRYNYPSRAFASPSRHDFAGASGVPYRSNPYLRNSAAGSVYPNDNRGGVSYPFNGGSGYRQPSNGSPGLAGHNPAGTSVVSSALPEKIDIEVFYETNCPDSMRFITNQLYPVYQDFKDILNLRLIPFGKARASYDEISKTYNFQCHHGPPECYGNKIQGCAMSFHPDTESHLNFINCMELYPRPSDNGPKCARRLSMDWKKISKCAEGPEGEDILFKHGKLTKELQPPVTFVPWININKVHSDSIQRRALRDLKSVICETYLGRHLKC